MRATICATPRKSAYMSIIKYGEFVNRFTGDGKKLFVSNRSGRVFSVASGAEKVAFCPGGRGFLNFKSGKIGSGRQTACKKAKNVI